MTQSNYCVGDWEVRPELNQLRCGARAQVIEPRLIALLGCFASEPGRVFNRDALIDKAWAGVIVSESTINHTVGMLRRALGDDARDPRYIQTVAKKGYRLIAEVGPIAAATESPPAFRPSALQALGFALGLSAIAGLVFWKTTLEVPASTASLSGWTEVQPLTSMRGVETTPAIDALAGQLYFAHTDPDQRFADLYRQSLTGGVPERLLPASPDSHESSPAPSPDGRWLAFARHMGGDCQIHLLALTGGALARNAREVSELAPCGPYDSRIQWLSADELMFVSAAAAREPIRVRRLNINSGERSEVTDASAGVGDFSFALSADRQQIAFLRTTHWNHSELYIQDLVSGERRLLQQLPTWFFDLAWSADGLSIYYASDPAQRTLSAIDVSTGQVRQVRNPAQGLFNFQVLESTQQLLASQRSWDSNIYIATLGESGDAQQIVASTRADWQPRLSPDGQVLAFLSDRTGAHEIWATDERGRNARQLSHLAGRLQIHVLAWSSDNRSIVYDDIDGQLHLLDVNSGQTTTLDDAGQMARNPSFSLDSQRVLYTAYASGSWQIWELTLATGQARQLTRHGAFSARYRNDGTLLISKYYKSGLWQVDPASGTEQLVVPQLMTGPLQQWVVRDQGIYYLDDSVGYPQLMFRQWGAQQAQLIRDLPSPGSSFEVSASGKQLMFTQADDNAADIVLLH